MPSRHRDSPESARPYFWHDYTVLSQTSNMADYRTMSAGARMSRKVWIVCFAALVVCNSVDGAKSKRNTQFMQEGFQEDAIDKLSKVFGFEKLPHETHHRSPPQYMQDLFNTVAYTDGISRTPNPYDADVVRGFPDRATTTTMHFVFNVSYINNMESILQAEFHLYRMRPQSLSSTRGRNRRNVHVIELRLYQILDENRITYEDGVKLLDRRRVSVYRRGWETFKVKETVSEWANGTSPNHGFLVTATSMDGEHVNGTLIEFAQRNQHHDSKQPLLAVFTEDEMRTLLATSDDELEGFDGGSRDLGSIRRNYVQFLNEGHRAKFGSVHYRRNYMSQDVHQRLIEETRGNSRTKRATDYYRYNRKRKKACARHELYVDFEEIGWSGWIISPKGYNAHHCKGQCPFPLGQNQKPTNHATVQSIVHALKIVKDVETPSCVPNKLYSISLLYFDDDENVILKQYDDMVAASCGCH